MGSTADVDARDNTNTGYTGDDTAATDDDSDLGVPIYWLEGAKVADDYRDFYDNAWDDEINAKDQSGADRNTLSIANWPITGSGANGTERFSGATSRALGADRVQVGRLDTVGNGPPELRIYSSQRRLSVPYTACRECSSSMPRPPTRR